MAEIDFTKTDNALAETFAINGRGDNSTIISLSEAEKPKKLLESLAPKIPNTAFDPTIPENVKVSMDEAQALARKNRTDERQRTENLINAIKEGQNITADAETNIANSESHMFGYIIGLSNDKYSVSKQTARIKDVQRKVQNQVKIGQLENLKDDLEESDAAADYTTYLRGLNLKQKALGMSTATMNAVIQSNAARKSLQNFQFSQATAQELKTRQQANDFDEVFTEQRITKYFHDVEKAQLSIDSSRLAFQNDKFDLGRKLEIEAIDRLPINYLRQQLDEADKAGEGFVTLGKDFKVARSRVQDIVAAKEDVAKKYREQETQRAVKLAQNNAEFNTAQRDMETVSRDFHGGVGQGLDKFNMLNTTDETLAGIDFQQLHPFAASEYFALQQHTANMNGKSSGPTTQDMEIQKELAKQLQTKLDTIKKNEIEAQSDKASKAAVQEWYNNGGRMSTGKNSATITATNITVMPDFGADDALEQSFLKFQHGMIEDLSGTTVDIFDEAGNLDTETFLQNALSKQLKGKQTNSQIVLRVMNQIDDNNQTPLSVYTNTKASNVLLQAVRALAEVNPQISASLLDENGNPTAAWSSPAGPSPVQLAVELARISHEALKVDPSLSANTFNFALQKEINNVIAQNAQQWNTQLNRESGSFMVNLFNNRPPAQLVDSAINALWARHVNGAWEALTQETTKKQVEGLDRFKAL